MNNNHQHHPDDLDRVLAEVPRAEAERLRAAWALAEDEAATDFPDPAAIEQVWQSLESFAASEEAPPVRPHAERAPRLRRVRVRPWMAVAATVLIGGALGVWAWWMQPVVETAPPGQRLAVALSDGSQIVLNSGATVRYARRFGEARVVHLEGEASFDVAKETRPFIVHTFNAQVTVLGTRFNVRAWSRSIDPATTVALETGRVALAPTGRPDQAVELEPGQIHRIGQIAHELTPPDTEALARAMAWQNGDLLFKDQWLGVILEDVERRFDVTLTAHPASLHRRSLELAIRNPANAEAVIRDICTALNLRFRETSNGYEIYAGE